MLQGLARYQIQKQLGEGLFTEIFQAIDLITQQTCVLKAMHMDKYPLDDKSKMFNEITLQSMINHPNVIAKFDSFHVERTIYVVLEFAPLGDLYSHLWVNKHPITDIDIRRLYLQICQGMNAIHSQGILHRDLKPENILIDNNLNAKICDFGWACHAHDHSSLKEVAGTIAYMSPECLHGHVQTTAADIWSLGILIYEMYHGREPFTGDTAQERYNSILNGLPQFDPVHPIEAAELFFGCVQLDPSARLTISQILNHRLFAPISYQYNQFSPQLYQNPDALMRSQIHSQHPSVSPALSDRQHNTRNYVPLTRSNFGTRVRRQAMPHYQAIVEDDKNMIREIHRSGKSRDISSRLSRDGKSIGRGGEKVVREFRPISTGPKRKHQPLILGSIDIQEIPRQNYFYIRPIAQPSLKDNSCIELNQTDFRKSWESVVTKESNNGPYNNGQFNNGHYNYRLGHTQTSSFQQCIHQSAIECNTYFMESSMSERIDALDYSARVNTEPIPIVEEQLESSPVEKPKVLFERRIPLRSTTRQNTSPVQGTNMLSGKPHFSFRQDRKIAAIKPNEKSAKCVNQISGLSLKSSIGSPIPNAISTLTQTIKGVGVDFSTMRKSNHTKKKSPGHNSSNQANVDVNIENTANLKVPNRNSSPTRKNFINQLMANAFTKKVQHDTIDKKFYSVNNTYKADFSYPNTTETKLNDNENIDPSTQINGFNPSFSKQSLISNKSDGKTDNNLLLSAITSPPLASRPGLLKLITDPANQSSLRQMLNGANSKAKNTPVQFSKKITQSPAEILSRYAKTKNSAPSTASKEKKASQAMKALTKLCLKSSIRQNTSAQLQLSARDCNELILTESHFNC